MAIKETANKIKNVTVNIYKSVGIKVPFGLLGAASAGIAFFNTASFTGVTGIGKALFVGVMTATGATVGLPVGLVAGGIGGALLLAGAFAAGSKLKGGYVSEAALAGLAIGGIGGAITGAGAGYVGGAYTGYSLTRDAIVEKTSQTHFNQSSSKAVALNEETNTYVVNLAKLHEERKAAQQLIR